MQLRTRALMRRRVPDELDRLLYVVPKTIWVLVASLTLVVAALLTWGFAGHLPRQLGAEGLLVANDGPRVVASTASGTVTDVVATPGAPVSSTTAIALVTSGRTVQTITAGVDGYVSAVDVNIGQKVGVGQELAIVQPRYGDPEELSAVVFLPRQQGAAVSVGMKTDLAVAAAPSARFGVLRGTVKSVAPYPASASTLTALLGHADLASAYVRNGPPLIARITLKLDDDTKSGLRWSNSSGPPFPLRPGTGVSVQITQQVQSPVDALFGG